MPNTNLVLAFPYLAKLTSLMIELTDPQYVTVEETEHTCIYKPLTIDRVQRSRVHSSNGYPSKICTSIPDLLWKPISAMEPARVGISTETQNPHIKESRVVIVLLIAKALNSAMPRNTKWA